MRSGVYIGQQPTQQPASKWHPVFDPRFGGFSQALSKDRRRLATRHFIAFPLVEYYNDTYHMWD
jgi:hypothetical protein